MTTQDTFLFVFFVLTPASIIALIYLWKSSLRLLYLTRKIRGPSLWELLTVHSLYLLSPYGFLPRLCELSAKYDYKLWGFWRGIDFFVVVSGPETAAELFKNKNLVDKNEKFYAGLASYLGQSSLVANGPKWRRHRNVAAPAFKKNILEAQIDVLNEEALKLTERLRTQTEEDCDIDPQECVAEQLVKVSVRSLECRDLPSLDASEFTWAIHTAAQKVQMKTVNPLLYFFVHKIRKKNRDDEARIVEIINRGMDRIYEQKQTILERLTRSGETPRQPLEFLLVSSTKKSGDRLVDREVLEEAMTLLAAASDTTGTVILLGVLLLALHQDVQDKLMEEIDSVFGGSVRPATPADFNKMEYLDMVVKEILRLFPPVPLLFRKASEETSLGGSTLPKGSCVIVNLYSLHRNPNVYKDPLKFDPQRFSRSGGGEKSRHAFAFIPFSFGLRNCVGKRQALLVIKTFLTTLMRNYKFVPGNGLHCVDDIRIRMRITLHLDTFNVRFLKRSDSYAR